MKGKMFWPIGAIFVLAGLFIVILIWQQFSGQSEQLTKKEAEAIIAEKYPGEVAGIQSADEHFTFLVDREEGVYEIVLDAKSGSVASIQRVSDSPKQKTAEENKDPAISSEDEIKDKPASEEQGAVAKNEKIAQNEKSGSQKETTPDGGGEKAASNNSGSGETKQIKPAKQEEPVKRLTKDQAAEIALKEVNGEVDDVDLETVNGISYYFVEIETDDDEEAIVQIDAITGAVKSVTWDD